MESGERRNLFDNEQRRRQPVQCALCTHCDTQHVDLSRSPVVVRVSSCERLPLRRRRFILSRTISDSRTDRGAQRSSTSSCDALSCSAVGPRQTRNSGTSRHTHTHIGKSTDKRQTQSTQRTPPHNTHERIRKTPRKCASSQFRISHGLRLTVQAPSHTDRFVLRVASRVVLFLLVVSLSCRVGVLFSAGAARSESFRLSVSPLSAFSFADSIPPSPFTLHPCSYSPPLPPSRHRDSTLQHTTRRTDGGWHISSSSSEEDDDTLRDSADDSAPRLHTAKRTNANNQQINSQRSSQSRRQRLDSATGARCIPAALIRRPACDLFVSCRVR